MKSISTSELAPLKFDKNVASQKMIARSKNIAWVHTVSDTPGASFDLEVYDSLGRLMFKREDCKSDHTEYGERANIPTSNGQDLEVRVTNIKGAKNVDVFLN